MRYNQLRAFNAVARDLSFSKAADALHVTQPAVTLQVQALEEAHGVRLFNRTRTGVKLTAEGEALLQLTRQMFAVEAQIGDFLAGAEALERGELILAADGPHVALDLVSEFRARHPGIDVRMRLGNFETTMADVLEQTVDAAVVANPPRDTRLSVIPVLRQDMVAIVPKNHPWAGRDMIGLKEIAGQPVILREPGSNTRRILSATLRKRRIALNPVLELGSREAVREAVALGLGIGFIQHREAVGDDRISAVRLRELRGSNLDTLVCLKRHAGRRAVAALMDVARDLSQVT